MPNNISLAKKYTPLLDEVYKQASVTNDLTSNPELIRAGVNANEIIYPQLTMDGLADYSRNSGYVSGSVGVEWKTAKFNYERGRKFSVDAMDNEETWGIAFGQLSSEFVRTKVVPEGDAFTFAKLAQTPNISTTAAATLADGAAFLTALVAAVTKMDDDEVPAEGRILYATSTLINAVKALDTIKSREILEGFSAIKKVPQSRFYTKIKLNNGTTSGEEAGHYEKADDGKDINFMIVHPSCLIKWDKHVVSDVIPANMNPDADADIVKYRKYGIVDVYQNKAAGIYLHHKAS